MEIRTISSFNDVVLTGKKVLILCDIDDTLLTFSKTINDYMEHAQNILPNESLINKLRYAESCWKFYRGLSSPILTDGPGFTGMISRMNMDSRIAFLTARTGGEFAKYTERDFQNIGIPYEAESVFYTNNQISKGEYIKKHIKTYNFDQVIFIDDLEENHRYVRIFCPNIECYKFNYSRPSLPSSSTV
jgi:hypothetical protein